MHFRHTGNQVLLTCKKKGNENILKKDSRELLVSIVTGIKTIGAFLAGITCNRDSSMARACSITQVMDGIEEACHLELAPTSSTTFIYETGGIGYVSTKQETGGKCMRILLINEVCGHTSTGRICAEIAEKYEDGGHTVKIAYGRSPYVPQQYQKFAVQIGNSWDVRLHALQTRLSDRHGFGSRKATEKFLSWAEKYRPSLVWLHNLHGYYINVELLFAWIKSHPELEVRWTLHDCWPFTGHCVHFTMAKCEKWRSGCYGCPQKREYPAGIFRDNSRNNYERKKKAFTGVRNMKIITPSDWLSGLARESFLGGYPVETRRNTVDRTVFRPRGSDFRKKYGLEGKTVILGAANAWEKRKGLYDFLELAGMLDETYAVVLVGITEKHIRRLPGSMRKMCLSRKAEKLTECPLAGAVSSTGRAAGLTGGKTGVAVPEGAGNLYQAQVFYKGRRA